MRNTSSATRIDTREHYEAPQKLERLASPGTLSSGSGTPDTRSAITGHPIPDTPLYKPTSDFTSETVIGIARAKTGHADIRSLMALLVISSVLVFTPSPTWLLLSTIVIIGLFSAITVPAKHLMRWAVASALFALGAYIIPTLWTNSLTVAVSFICYWLLKFGVNAILLLSFYTAITPAGIAASLTAMRTPRVLYIPILVMIRYFPVAVAELRHIYNGMRLRGLASGVTGASRHPLRFGTLLLIPFLLSATRIVDELSAAALLKGVGSTPAVQRSVLVPPRFRALDALALALTVLLIALKGVSLWLI